MQLIPVIELEAGKCRQRLPGVKTGADDPVRTAQHWHAAGARRLHVVDTDSAGNGKSPNLACLRDMIAACDGANFQIAAGIRSEEHAGDYFDAGAEFLVLGTRALSAAHLVNDLCLEYPGHIMVNLDIRDGRLAAEGWSKHANHDIEAVLDTFHREGVAAAICNAMNATVRTDAHPAVALARTAALPVIAADNLASLAQLETLCREADGALYGTLLGTALYAGKLDFAGALKLADVSAQR
ncbi:MAG TPA: HisA/HisF-related TIM barrel protein [Gammaproteobacteria bacterium]|nr:HisA/HisF-related TIM barrel protein [Gammaproteobacteria bacterium]